MKRSCVGDDVTHGVTSGVAASIHAQNNRTGNTYRVLWRDDGRQRFLAFENLPSAERFKTMLEDHGPDEALRIIELDEIGRHVPTVTEWLNTHIDNLTGIQSATVARYRTYVTRDVDPVFGSMPISAVTETTIARWIKQLGGSGKTMANNHGFLRGVQRSRAGQLERSFADSHATTSSNPSPSPQSCPTIHCPISLLLALSHCYPKPLRNNQFQHQRAA